MINRTLVLLGATAFCLAACKHTTLTSPTLNEALKDAGWSFIGLPSSVYIPGSIVQVLGDGRLRYRGHIQECDIPINISINDVALEGTINGSSSMNLASTVSAFTGLELKAGLDRSLTAKVTITDAKMHTISELVLLQNINNKLDTMTDICKTYIKGSVEEQLEGRNDRYILTNVLAVEGYKVQVVRSNGVSIDVDLGNVADYFQGEALQRIQPGGNGSFKIGSSSDVDIGQQNSVYLAFQGGPILDFGVPLGAGANRPTAQSAREGASP